MIEVKYNEKENIIYLRRVGEIELNDILKLIEEIDINFKSLQSLYIIDDLKESTMKYQEEDYPGIIAAIKTKVDKYKEVRTAILVDTPEDTVFSYLYEQSAVEIKNYEYRTFSTLNAAKFWIQDGGYYEVV